MRVQTAIALLALVVLLSGCAADAGADAGAGAGGTTQQPTTQANTSGGLHQMADGTQMSDSDMAGMDSNSTALAKQPSAAAAMICSDEIHLALKSNIGDTVVATSTSRWAGGIYTCTYHLSAGDLVLSVNDATDEAAGQQYFDAMRARMPGLEPIKGMASLGLTGYEDGAGTVLLLKDGKALDFDATALAPEVGRYHQSPADVAYGLAASILACWSEH